MSFRLGLAIVFASALTACTTLPNVQSSYFLPRSDMTITVTRTVGCSAASSQGGAGIPVGPVPAAPDRTLYSTTAVVATPAYSADIDARANVNIARLDGPLADASITLEYYDDGRLKGVNTTTAGQGTAVVQAVASLVPAVFALASDDFSQDERQARNAINAACSEIDRLAGDGKTVSMVHEYSEDFAAWQNRVSRDAATGGDCQQAQVQEVGPPIASSNCSVAQPRRIPLSIRDRRLASVNDLLPQFCTHFEATPAVQPPLAVWGREGSRNAVSLLLRRPARYVASVFQIPAIGIPPAPNTSPEDRERAAAQAYDDACFTAAASVRRAGTLWSGTVLIPLTRSASLVQFGDEGTYQLPVPRGAPFGGNALKLAISEAGAVTTLGYGNTSGTASAIGAVSSISGAATDSAAERAARYQSESDLIVQQQRLIRCQQNREECK